MEIKKNPKVDVQNKRVLLLEIGLATALLIIIGAFLYAPREYKIEQVEQVVLGARFALLPGGQVRLERVARGLDELQSSLSKGRKSSFCEYVPPSRRTSHNLHVCIR